VCDGESAYDLARQAAGALLRKNRIAPDDVDLILYAGALESVEPPKRSKSMMDRFNYPASRLQYELGMRRAVTVGVSQAGCASFFAAVRLAHDLLIAEPALRRILCVASDVLPRTAKREILFNLISDGACSAMVDRSSRTNRLISYAQVSKGAHWNAREKKHEIIASYFPTAIAVIEEALRRADLDRSAIKLVIPHNVSAESWKILLRMVGIPQERLFRSNIAAKGHTIAADPMINLSDAVSRGRVKRGDYLMLFTFGFGAHWACMIVQH
jgi:3-oxoacyl-[acyl-carrier-protein] synthase-3